MAPLRSLRSGRARRVECFPTSGKFTAEGRIAVPSGKIDRQGRERDHEALRALIEEREIERVVVGLPKHMDGREGVEARAARDFAADLASLTGLPVDTLDERLTTVEAERVLRASGRKAKKQREALDRTRFD